MACSFMATKAAGVANGAVAWTASSPVVTRVNAVAVANAQLWAATNSR
jgi:hypothetical protein